jgi:imidazolonepropionase-like amidohydrolase
MTGASSAGVALADPSGQALEVFDLVIRRARVFDGQTILSGLRDIGVGGGEIAVVSETPISGRKEIDADGGWLMPGLIDTHLHFYDFRTISDPSSLAAFVENEVPGRLELFLQHGVTTIKSVGDPTAEILDTRAKLAAGRLRGPRLVATGNGITGREGHPASTIFGGNPWFRARATGEVGSVQQMRDLVHHLADRGVDAIKLLSEGGCNCPGSPKYIWQNPVFPAAVELIRLPTEIMKAGIDVAHDRGLRVTVHTTQQDAAREAIEAGADGLEHGVTVETITDHGLIDLMLAKGATYTPTLWIHAAVHPHSSPNTKIMADAGVTMVLGSDTFSGRGLFGANTLEEAELMVAAGMAPVDVLVAGTSNAAKQCVRPDLGSIESGKRADMILLAGDPTQDIGALRQLKMTVLGGEVVVDKR